ncbi:MerR family transcriptional regulator [Anabaena azotica]|uniref:Helix-turn-helix domain-containing protein n=1 Tax=Anabaena azotica FACHB-119 TaxID=947527 RepID=A0ABR8DD88_9NOST|nr:hypothetical protein [Anabaena azotica]MBD2505074.1 hypothetical protein [Anabaena azotica FACHB-119]
MYRRWTEAELITLEQMAETYTVKQIAFRLKRRGYYRSELAIAGKLYKLGYSIRPTLDNYSCSEIAKNLCLHPTTIRNWVRQGWLKAKKRSVHCYQVRSQDLKRFFQNPPASIRKRIMAIDPQVISYLVG